MLIEPPHHALGFAVAFPQRVRTLGCGRREVTGEATRERGGGHEGGHVGWRHGELPVVVGALVGGCVEMLFVEFGISVESKLSGAATTSSPRTCIAKTDQPSLTSSFEVMQS